MFCTQCGAELEQDAIYCIRCGVRQSVTRTPAETKPDLRAEEEPASPAAGNVGFSEKISEPSFERYTKASTRGAAIFALILALAAVAGFSIAGATGAGGMTNPQGIFIGLGLGGLFFLISMIQLLKKKSDTSWEGSVVDKSSKKKRKKQNDGDDFQMIEYMEYTVTVRDDRGKNHTLRQENNVALYHYYQVGDRVKHHKGLSLYEKYDKTNDQQVICVVCGTMNSFEADVCKRCKCPILK